MAAPLSARRYGRAVIWADTGLVAVATWTEIEACGRQLRWLWASFARGEDLGVARTIPGALRCRRFRP